MIMPSNDIFYNGRKGIGFENPRYFEKAKDFRPILYDEKVWSRVHSGALEIEKFKRSRENKIEFAYDYGNLNASYVNEKINFSNDYFQEIINPDFEKIDSPFQQTSSLKPMYDLLDDNNFFIFDDESVKISLVSKMPFRKKPRDSMNVRSKSNLNKSLPRTVHMMNDLLDDNNFFIFDDESVKIYPVSKMPFRKKPHDYMNIVQICLWIIDSGCSKHMTGNRTLLMNFVEKFLGTIRFGNNDFAVIAVYEDVVIGSMTIKKVYYSKV
uniref:Integrase, catalytic region, zinc finger, CCHC-type, peptidase aspartic, catalytic n=1 Tax=Tanacetum cinerariifolium TaxID=118510 RepID=A0A699LA64_TANCI|nr:integrase, catalytic region, zinc finger, CCHC-type, peptidase aspartic, catalytic [Tanacetum cinerariifolium]